MKAREAARLFLKEFGKGKAEKTVVSYAKGLDLFVDYLGDWAGIKSLRGMNREHIEEFLTRWYIRKYLPSSASGAKELLKILRKFFRWLQQKRLKRLAGEMEEIYQTLKEDLPNCFKIQEMLWKEGELLSYLINENRISQWERGIRAMVFHEYFKEKWLKFSEEIRSFLAKGEGKYVEGGNLEVIEVGPKCMWLKSFETGEKIGPVRICNRECLKLLKERFVVNAGLYKVGKEWRIVELGFVYPPRK